MSEIILTKKEVIKLESKETRIGLKRKLEPYAFLFPSLLLFGLFVYYPFLKTLYMSFSLTNAHGGFQEFISIQNYVEIFTSADFIYSLVVTMKFVFITTIPSIIIGLFLALLANNKVKGIGISKVMFAVPIAVSSASASIIWGIIFHPSIGMLNNILKTSIGWLIDPHWALLSVAFVTIWMNIGVNFIFILAGLKNVQIGRAHV